MYVLQRYLLPAGSCDRGAHEKAAGQKKSFWSNYSGLFFRSVRSPSRSPREERFPLELSDLTGENQDMSRSVSEFSVSDRDCSGSETEDVRSVDVSFADVHAETVSRQSPVPQTKQLTRTQRSMREHVRRIRQEVSRQAFVQAQAEIFEKTSPFLPAIIEKIQLETQRASRNVASLWYEPKP